MVKVLSAEDKLAVADAITQAEKKTGAELVAVVAAASDAYQGPVFLAGLAAGSLLAMVLWGAKPATPFPCLLAIQLAVLVVVSGIPPLRQLCLRVVPKQVLRHRAAHRAYEEYLAVSRHVPAVTPIALLYVSVAERYAHILTSRSVRERIPDEKWNDVISAFTAAVHAEGVKGACISAIEQMCAQLSPHFPEKGEGNALRKKVIER